MAVARGGQGGRGIPAVIALARPLRRIRRMRHGASLVRGIRRIAVRDRMLRLRGVVRVMRLLLLLRLRAGLVLLATLLGRELVALRVFGKLLRFGGERRLPKVVVVQSRLGADPLRRVHL